MPEIKKVTFVDFQTLLTEAGGRPVYQTLPDRFVLQWIGGSFLYQTEATFQDIQNSYKQESDEDDRQKAIKLFKDRYLKNCYEYLEVIPINQKIAILGTPMPPVEGASWDMKMIGKLRDFKPRSLRIETSGRQKIIIGELLDGQFGRLAVLERSEGPQFALYTEKKDNIGIKIRRKGNVIWIDPKAKIPGDEVLS